MALTKNTLSADHWDTVINALEVLIAFYQRELEAPSLSGRAAAHLEYNRNVYTDIRNKLRKALKDGK